MNSKRFSCLIFLICCFVALSRSADIYSYLDTLLDHHHYPRQLNTEDISKYFPNAQPQPLIAPQGDFNADGIPDVAIAGVYDVTSSPQPYFLLVATTDKNTSRPKILYLESFSQPPFLFEKKTTGEGDPGDQAFSLSFCTGCAQGWDFYWDSSNKKFDLVPWKTRRIHHTDVIKVEGESVPQDIVDRTLKLAGQLPDVIVYVEGLKKSGRNLGTRVQSKSPETKGRIYQVTLFEKKKGKEILYDSIEIDIVRNTVIKRNRKKN